MNTSWATDPVRRERRKQDLLLASNLMRLHADAALREIGEPLDLWAGRAVRLRQALHEFTARPALVAGAGLLAFVITLARRSRRPRTGGGTGTGNLGATLGRAWGLGWTVWRLWRRWQSTRPPAA
jgi:hypothetical protein